MTDLARVDVLLLRALTLAAVLSRLSYDDGPDELLDEAGLRDYARHLHDVLSEARAHLERAAQAVNG